MVLQSDSPKYSFLQVTSLEGRNLSLKPLTEADLAPMAKALISDTTWFAKTRGLTTVPLFSDYFRPMIERRANGEAMTLVVRLHTGEIVAMSTFQYPSAGFAKIEIGFTWIADSWQRTFVNTEMKYLMLKHAFETMGVKRVEFCVHPDNPKSNAAMIRIGATLEGTLRKFRFLTGSYGIGDNGNRNLYSIIDDEWPSVCGRVGFRSTPS